MADTILHNQPEGTPSDNELIAYGTPTTPAGNIKLSNFYNLLMSKLGFFKVSNLFSEIFGNPTSMASARANLSVPSVSDMQTADNLKANKSNVIEKDSTVDYTPTIGTHPVPYKIILNKFYSDGQVFNFGDISVVKTMTVPIGKTMIGTNYVVFLEFQQIDTILPYAISNKTVNSFDVSMAEVGGNVNTVLFRWFIIMY